MKRDILGFLIVRRLRQSPAFAFLVAALLCGVFAGGFTGMYIPQSDGSYVQELAKLVSSNAAGRMPSVRTVLTSAASTVGWIAAAGLLGAIPGRALWMALLLAVRGFFLSFAAAAALVQSGLWGVYIAFVSIGICAVFWLPAMLLIGTAALDIGMQHGKYFAAWKPYGGLWLLCILLLCASMIWRLLLVPVLLGLF